MICSSLLYEVPSPVALLRAAREMCRAGGIVHVDVPNATSFHRRLAVAMGLIESVKSFSDRNVNLQQQRVFDADLLRAAVLGVGLLVGEEGGYFVKPFTHRQMEQILPIVGTEVLPGLWELERQMPSIAAEFYINATNPPGVSSS